MKRGHEHGNWQGLDVGYRAAHLRVEKLFGKANEHICVICPEQANEWGYSNVGAHEQVDPRGRRYSTDVDDYDPMCRGCHRYNDGIMRRALESWAKPEQDPRGDGVDGPRARPPGQGRQPVTLRRTVWW